MPVTMYWPTGFRKSGLGKPLAQVIFRVTGRAVLELAKHLVATLLIEPERLVAVGIECGRETAAARRVCLGRLHQSRAVALTAHHFGQPDKADIHPTAPGVAEEAAQPFALPVLEEEANRMPFIETGARDIEHAQAVSDELAQLFGRQRVEYNLEVFHPAPSGPYRGPWTGSGQWQPPAGAGSSRTWTSTGMAARTGFCGCSIRCTAQLTASSRSQSWC